MKRMTIDELRVAAVFGEIGAGENADRRGEQRGRSPSWIRLPTIELSRPPATPGGAVILVKTSSDRPPTPFQSSAPRISASQTQAEGRGGVAQRRPDGVARAAAGDRENWPSARALAVRAAPASAAPPPAR